MSEFRSGYGQAKADALLLVKEAMQTVDLALKDLGDIDDATEIKQGLKTKQASLSWVRSCLKSLKSPR